MGAFDFYTVHPSVPSIRLNEFLSRYVGISKKKAKRIVDEGLCCVNGVKELRYSRNAGLCRLDFVVPRFLFAKPSIAVVYEDEYMVVVDKPPYINSNEGNASVEFLLKVLKSRSFFAIHRLDRHTTGLLMLSKSRRFLELMKPLFKMHSVRKLYRAVVAGDVRTRMMFSTRLDGGEAITKVVPLVRYGFATYISVEIVTGRKHQIRRHLAERFNYVCGEYVYYRGVIVPEVLRYSPRIMLHASFLEFKHPATGKLVTLESSIPEDFSDFLKLIENRV